MKNLRKYMPGIVAMVVFSFWPICAFGDTGKTAALQVGAGRSEIKIPGDAFPFSKEGFTGVHDPIYARTLLLDNGVTRIAFVVMDFTSFSPESIADKIDAVSKAVNVNKSNFYLVAAHNFSSPHFGLPPNATTSDADKLHDSLLQKAISDALLESAIAADKNLQPAKVGFGKGTANVNVNRDLPIADGYWQGNNMRGFSDKDVCVIKFETLGGKPIAFIMNYGVQSSVEAGTATIGVSATMPSVSGDLAGAACRFVERQYGDDVVALWGCGAAGDQQPIMSSNVFVTDKDGKLIANKIPYESVWPILEGLGGALGSEAVRTGREISLSQTVTPLRIVSGNVKCDGQYIPPDITLIKPTKSYEYKTTGSIDCPYWILQIGDIAIVGVQVELTSAVGFDIKKNSPFKNTMVITMVNGLAKYMADSSGYENCTYEAMNSKYAKGSAERVSASIIETLKGMKQ